MMMKKTNKMKWLLVAAVAAFAVQAGAQQMLPTNTEAAQLQDAIAQTTGEFDQMDLGYIHSLGMQQKAWNDPLSHMGEGQLKPGYSRYNWSPDVILPIRLREGMMTLINLPSWELIEKVHIGSPESFGGEIAAPNSLLLYADPSYIGVDCNMIVFGRSGNRYVFYLRSETYNTDKITQSVVDVLVGPRFTPVSAGGTLGSYNGASVSMAAVSANGFASAPGWSGQGGSLTPGGRQNPQIGLNTATTGPKDWLKSIDVDPESFRFDIDMYLPNPSDVDIAPDNVWRDNIFTYIDLGPKALTMTQRPIVNLIVEDSEVPVGFRTRGPNSRLIVVEGIGDMVLRNGKKLICLKLRRDPASGLEWTDYSGDSARPERWTAPAQPDNYGAGDGALSVDAMLQRKQTALTMDGEPIPAADNGRCTEGDEYCDTYRDEYDDMANPYADDGAGDASDRVMNGGMMAPMNKPIPQDVLSSPAAGAGIADVMQDITITDNGSYVAVSDQYRADVRPAARTQNKGVRNRRVTPNVAEAIAVELGANANIAALEKEWEQIYSKNEDVLKGYEPYYSVDATADGDVRELFRLRIGPVKSVRTGDTLCRKLGRRGFSCTVVRIQ